MRRIVHIGAVAATTAAIFPALAGFFPAQIPEAAATDKDSATGDPLLVEEITPKSVGDDSRVRITGQVTNTTDSELDGISVRFRYSQSPLSERSDLDAFTSGDGSAPGTQGAEVDLPDGLEPGETGEYTLRADAAELSLSSWGVYPLMVEAVDGSGEELGKQRTFLPYRGGGSAPASLDIAWVWPLMDQPQRAGNNTFMGGSLPESLSADGRLGRLLTAGAQDGDVSLEPEEPTEEPSASASESESESESAPEETEETEETAAGDEDTPTDEDGEDPAPSVEAPQAEDDSVPITWAVDPGLLADIDRLTSRHRLVEDPPAAAEAADADADDSRIASSPMEAAPEAQIWLDQAQTALAEDSLVATPYASADVAALTRHGLSDDADAAMDLGRDAVDRTLELAPDETVALPEGGLMNKATREFYQRHGASTFLLRDDGMPAQPWLDSTPTAETPLSLGKGEEGAALVADDGLSAALNQPSDGPGEAALAQQRFAAETAMIAGEDPGTPRTVVAYPPTDWDPGTEFAQEALESSDSLPWLDPVSLTDVEPDGASSGEGRQDLTYPKSATRAELGRSYLNGIKDVRAHQVRLFNSMLADDEDPFRPALLRLESAAWRREDELARPARALVEQAVEKHLDKVRILPTEPVTLATTTGTIGILIANDLENHSIRVNLSMLSGNPERLSIGDYQDTIEIGPGGKTTVYVQLSARVNGRTMIQMNLHNLGGEPVDQEQYLSVNATGMGTQALVISGIGALVLVAALTPRAMRKWARNRAESIAAAPDDPEDAAAKDAQATGDEEGRSTQDDASSAAPGMQHNEEESASPRSADSNSAPPPGSEDGSSRGSNDGR